MLNHRIDRSDWGAFFDRLTAGHADVPSQATARLQINRPDGDATPDDLAHDRAWLPFLGVRWEPTQETITVALAGLDHRIESPVEVWTEDPPGEPLQRLLVLGAHGRRDEVAFKMAGLRG